MDRNRRRSSSGWLLIVRLLQNAAIELQPGQLAVVKARRTRRRRRGRRGLGAVPFPSASSWAGSWKTYQVPTGTGHDISGNYATISPARPRRAQLCNSKMKVRWRSAPVPYPDCRRARISAAKARVTLRCEAMAALSISATMVAAASMDCSMCRAIWLITCGSTTSCRSMKCLTRTALSRASSGGAMVTSGSARRRDRRSGRLTLELARRHARGEQHGQLVLAHQVEQVEQGALVADAGVQVLDQQRRCSADAAPHRPRAAPGLEPCRARLQAPHVGEVRLAGTRRSHHDDRGMRPVGPAVDDVGRRLVRSADEKVLRAQRRPVRQIEEQADPMRRLMACPCAEERGYRPAPWRPCRRSCQIDTDGEAHQHANGRRQRHRHQRTDQTEQIAEHEQREDQPNRMQADLLPDEPRRQKRRVDGHARDQHARPPWPAASDPARTARWRGWPRRSGRAAIPRWE